MGLSTWAAIGRCLRRFQDYGLCHSDLNAHNILLRGEEEVFLIDFDNGRRRGPGLWRDANLARLRRSLDKLEDGAVAAALRRCAVALPAVGLPVAIAMARLLYTLLLALLLPLVIIWMKWRGWRNPAHRGSLRQRLAIGLQQRQDHPLWLHAASVGEVQALAGLVRLLLREQPAQPLLITVGSPTGVTRAEALFAQEMQARPGEAPRVTVLLAPFDLPGVARRFLAANRPLAGAFVETEIWPNMIAVASRARRAPVHGQRAGVGAIHAAATCAMRAGLVRRTLRRHSVASARRARRTAQRFIRLGADPSRLQVIGQPEVRFPAAADIEQQGQAAARALCAASTDVGGGQHASGRGRNLHCRAAGHCWTGPRAAGSCRATAGACAQAGRAIR